MEIILYKTSSNPNVMNKSLTLVATLSCDLKSDVDRENPQIYVTSSSDYPTANYMYIGDFGRYYWINPITRLGANILLSGQSDPLMSFRSAVLSSPAVISRNPWHFDLYVPDPKFPIEARTASAILNFPNDPFDDTDNCYILTTIGGMSS